MNRNILIAVLVVLLAGLGYYAFSRTTPVEQKVGAVSGPISAFNYDCLGGVCTYRYSTGLKTATTTPCAFQNGAATSTATARLRLDTSSTTATIWSIGTAASAYATTTQLGTDYAVAGSAKAFINASSSPAAGAAEVIAPNNWVVFSAKNGMTAGDTAGTGFVPAGQCAVTFTNTIN